METNPTPQPSDVGEVEKLLDKYGSEERAFARGWDCTPEVDRQNVLAAVRTLAGERNVAKSLLRETTFPMLREAINSEMCTKLYSQISELRRQLTDAQARESRMRDERDALREALVEIKEHYGKVCDNFELCTHAACRSSVSSWMAADAALRKATALAGAGESTEKGIDNG